QRFTGAFSEPHFHAHTVGAGPDARSESNSIGQHAFEIKGAVHAPVPFEALQGKILFRPHGGNVRVREVNQTEVRPEGFGHVHYNIARGVPRREDTDLGFALRVNGAVQKSDA